MNALRRLAPAALWFLTAPSLAADSLPEFRPGSEFRLGPEDVIEVSVRPLREADKTLTITPDGRIAFPEVGELTAAGKTPRALAEEIRARLDRLYNNITVTVAVREIRSRRVRVVGTIRQPGAYALSPHGRLLDLIAVAGGLTGRPARMSARLVGNDGAMRALDLPGALARPDSDANPPLNPDDLVIVEEMDPARQRVFVVGEVARPGAVELGDAPISLVSLLSLAGNATDRAALARAYVLRDRAVLPVDLRAFVAEGRADPRVRGFVVQAGDMLVIPPIDVRIAVMGQVNRPGYFPLPERRDTTVLDALSMAGGQTPSGDLKRAGVVRMSGGRATLMPLDIEQMLRKGKLAHNVVLQPEDVLFIPSRSDRRFNWESIVAPLTALSYLGIRMFR